MTIFSIQSSNGMHISLSKFNIMVFNTDLGVSMFRSISHILLLRPPTKIRQSIVPGNAIQVTAFHTFWAGTYKCFQNNSMDTLPNYFVTFRKGHKTVPLITFVRQWL